MLRTIGTTILPIIAGYLLSKVDPIESIFAPYLKAQWQLPVLLSATLLLCFLIPYRIYQNKKYRTHINEQRDLFKSAKAAIRQRSGITLNQIHEFKAVFDEYKYFIKTKQEKFLSALLSDLQDLRIFTEERKGNITAEARKTLVAKERVFLDRIASALVTIEQYERKIT